eukprot:Skav217803  [mRNA]  locus=scaffold1782:499553:529753:- [translate_table: standard]
MPALTVFRIAKKGSATDEEVKFSGETAKWSELFHCDGELLQSCTFRKEQQGIVSTAISAFSSAVSVVGSAIGLNSDSVELMTVGEKKYSVPGPFSFIDGERASTIKLLKRLRDTDLSASRKLEVGMGLVQARYRANGFMVVLPAVQEVQEILGGFIPEGEEICVSTEVEMAMETSRGRALGNLNVVMADLPWSYLSLFRRTPPKSTAGRVIMFKVGSTACKPVERSALDVGHQWIGDCLDPATGQEYTDAMEDLEGDEFLSDGQLGQQDEEPTPSIAAAEQSEVQEMRSRMAAMEAMLREVTGSRTVASPPARQPLLRTLDPMQRLLYMQMQQTNSIVQSLLMQKQPSSDPLSAVLNVSDSASGNSSGSSVNVKGYVARDAFLKHLEDDARVVQVIRQNARTELGVTEAKEEPSLLRTYLESREAKKLLKFVQQLEEKVTQLTQSEDLINKLLQRGWELPPTAQKLAITPEDGDAASFLLKCGLDAGELSHQLRKLDSDRVEQWFQEPVSSWVNGQWRESQVDVKHLEQVLGQVSRVTGEESEGEPVERWPGPQLQQISGGPELQAVSMVLAPSAGEAAHFTRQVLASLNFCRIDALFACHKQSCPLGVEGLLWRIREGHQLSPVLVLALPERLPVESQDEIQRQLADCQCALKESGKLLVIVIADERSKMFHRLTDFRRPDLEAAAKSLGNEELEQVCPFQKDVKLLEGPPLSGKSSELKTHPANRLALRPDLSELEFCRLCRRICRDGESPELVLDFGWTDIEGKLSSCGMLLLPLLLFGVAGLSLSYPFCLTAPRPHGTKRLVLEVGPAEKIGLFSSLRSHHQRSICERAGRSGPQQWPLPSLEGLLAQKEEQQDEGFHVVVDEREVVSALQDDFQGSGYKQLIHHPYTHTVSSLKEMLQILKSMNNWRRSDKNAAHAPIIVLLGETGTGKTYLLTKTCELYGRYVEQLDLRVLKVALYEEQPDNIAAFLEAHNKDVDCEAIVACLAAVQKLGVAVSLRDAIRCSRLHQQLLHLGDHYKKKEVPPDALKDFYSNASALALYLCYGLQLPREDFWKLDIFKAPKRKGFRNSIQDVRRFVFEMHKPPSWVVRSEQLEDNLLLLTVAYAASFKDLYLHLLLLGNEGAAKTLSITLFLAAAKGQFANSNLFKALPSAQTVRIQLSSGTTAAHLRDVADTAQEFAKMQQASATQASRVVVVMEELGMASHLHEKPLKALHHLMARNERLRFKSPWEDLQRAKTMDQAKASLKRLSAACPQDVGQPSTDSLASVEESLVHSDKPTIAVAICTSFPRRESLQLSLLDGSQDLSRKLRENQQEILVLDLHGLSQTEFLNYGLTLSLGGGPSKELAWCKSLCPKMSKMPRKILLLMPPYLAQRLETGRLPEGHEVKEWWLDDASDGGNQATDLSNLLRLEHLWSALVQPICEQMVASFSGGEVDPKFAVELLSEVLKRTVPLLNPDDAARVDAMKQLALQRVELGSFRSLVETVACSSARHAACRFRPWLHRCLSSEFSETNLGREILLKSIRLAPLSFMNRLQPVGEMEKVLLECPRQLPDSPGPQAVLFPFVEELVAIVNRVAEHSWGSLGARDLSEKLNRAWPDLFRNENLNTKILWSCLENQLPGQCHQVVQAYLETIRNQTSDTDALLVACTEKPLMDALSFVQVETVPSFEHGPANVLFDACRGNRYVCSDESLVALREASRRLDHPELSQLSALWWALMEQLKYNVDYAWHCAQSLFDADAPLEQNVDVHISIPLVMGLAQFLPNTRSIFPAVVNSHPEAAAFLVARASEDTNSPNDAGSQLRSLRVWLHSALGGAAWSAEYLESPQAKFACSLMSWWLKGVNLSRWLQSFRTVALKEATDAAETLSILAAACHIVPKLAQDWEPSRANCSALERMVAVTGLRRPVENYFVRLLALHHGENLAPLASSLEPLGDWIHPFIKAPPSEADREVVRQLMFLPRFSQLLEASNNDWACALQHALEVDLSEGALKRVKSVANVEALGHSRAAAAIWLALLGANPTSAFAFNPSMAGNYVLPLQRPDEIRTDQIAGATRQYRFGPQCQMGTGERCSCGQPYFIGECGQAMQMATCPSCGGPIGGQNHQLLNINHANAGRTEAIWLIQVQLLLPLAVSFPRKYGDDLRKNLKTLCGQLEISDGQGALLLAKVFHRHGGQLLLPGIAFSHLPGPAEQAEQMLRTRLQQQMAHPNILKQLLQEAEAELETAGQQLLPIEQLRESEIKKRNAKERRDEFASEVLQLPAKDVWSKWHELSNEEKSQLPLAGLFTSNDWKEQARVLQQLPELVVGWCHLHSFVRRNGKEARKTELADCEELLHAALQLQGPKLLAETWPSLVSVKDEEVVKVRYNQLDSSVVETSIHHAEGGLDGVWDELKNAEPKLLAEMLLGLFAHGQGFT